MLPFEADRSPTQESHPLLPTHNLMTNAIKCHLKLNPIQGSVSIQTPPLLHSPLYVDIHHGGSSGLLYSQQAAKSRWCRQELHNFTTYRCCYRRTRPATAGSPVRLLQDNRQHATSRVLHRLGDFKEIVFVSWHQLKYVTIFHRNCPAFMNIQVVYYVQRVVVGEWVSGLMSLAQRKCHK